MRDERVPLRTILQNFINHFEDLESKLKDGEDLYETEFQELKNISDALKTQNFYSSEEGHKPPNRRKNRYKDILPFDVSRVVLSEYPGVLGSDYINANYIRGASGSQAYIAAQGPLPHTVADFWRLAVECEVQVIIMACNETESGKHKCENYWPYEEGGQVQYGDVSVTLQRSRRVCSDFTVRKLLLQFPDKHGNMERRMVCQFHYSAWPDHGVPSSVLPLLRMIRMVRDTQASETLPVLVHCSAGCGRTGTVCAIDYVWGLLRAGKLTATFSLFDLVAEMRRQRIAMVQTRDQYILVYRAVRQLFGQQLRVIEDHPYANVGPCGAPLSSLLLADGTSPPAPDTNSNHDDQEEQQHIYSPLSDCSSPLPCDVVQQRSVCTPPSPAIAVVLPSVQAPPRKHRQLQPPPLPLKRRAPRVGGVHVELELLAEPEQLLQSKDMAGGRPSDVEPMDQRRDDVEEEISGGSLDRTLSAGRRCSGVDRLRQLFETSDDGAPVAAAAKLSRSKSSALIRPVVRSRPRKSSLNASRENLLRVYRAATELVALSTGEADDASDRGRYSLPCPVSAAATSGSPAYRHSAVEREDRATAADSVVLRPALVTPRPAEVRQSLPGVFPAGARLSLPSSETVELRQNGSPSAGEVSHRSMPSTISDSSETRSARARHLSDAAISKKVGQQRPVLPQPPQRAARSDSGSQTPSSSSFGGLHYPQLRLLRPPPPPPPPPPPVSGRPFIDHASCSVSMLPSINSASSSVGNAMSLPPYQSPANVQRPPAALQSRSASSLHQQPAVAPRPGLPVKRSRSLKMSTPQTLSVHAAPRRVGPAYLALEDAPPVCRSLYVGVSQPLQLSPPLSPIVAVEPANIDAIGRYERELIQRSRELGLNDTLNDTINDDDDGRTDLATMAVRHPAPLTSVSGLLSPALVTSVTSGTSPAMNANANIRPPVPTARGQRHSDGGASGGNYSNYTPLAVENLRRIESHLRQNPRSGLYDVTSGGTQRPDPALRCRVAMTPPGSGWAPRERRNSFRLAVHGAENRPGSSGSPSHVPVTRSATVGGGGYSDYESIWVGGESDLPSPPAAPPLPAVTAAPCSDGARVVGNSIFWPTAAPDDDDDEESVRPRVTANSVFYSSATGHSPPASPPPAPALTVSRYSAFRPYQHTTASADYASVRKISAATVDAGERRSVRSDGSHSAELADDRAPVAPPRRRSTTHSDRHQMAGARRLSASQPHLLQTSQLCVAGDSSDDVRSDTESVPPAVPEKTQAAYQIPTPIEETISHPLAANQATNDAVPVAADRSGRVRSPSPVLDAGRLQSRALLGRLQAKASSLRSRLSGWSEVTPAVPVSNPQPSAATASETANAHSKKAYI